jgi:hypothetical protein
MTLEQIYQGACARIEQYKEGAITLAELINTLAAWHQRAFTVRAADGSIPEDPEWHEPESKD